MKYRIEIPKPCAKNWQQTNVLEKEKSYVKCNKIVFDLTTLTDEKLVDKIHQKERTYKEIKNNLLSFTKNNTILVIPYLRSKTTTLNISEIKKHHTLNKEYTNNKYFQKNSI